MPDDDVPGRSAVVSIGGGPRRGGGGMHELTYSQSLNERNNRIEDAYRYCTVPVKFELGQTGGRHDLLRGAGTRSAA